MTSRIERGITIEGSIRGEGELEVAGRVRGALTLSGKLIVEQGGIVEADVEATDIEVAGLLAGSATAHNSVQVMAGGRVEARIKAPRLLVDDGALFRGELMAQGSAATDAEPAIGLGGSTAKKAALPASVPAPAPAARPAPESAPHAERAPIRERPSVRERPSTRDARAREERAQPAPIASDTSLSSRPPSGPSGSRAPSTVARRGPAEGEAIVMPMLPRGRTRIRVRGGES
jgi:cytoskeletal protein CcmA (bactofilin family)